MEDPGDAVLAAHQSAAYPMRAGASAEMPTTLAVDEDHPRRQVPPLPTFA